MSAATVPAKRRKSARTAVRCDRRVVLKATGEKGQAFCRWQDGTFAVKLEIGVWTDVNEAEVEWFDD